MLATRIQSYREHEARLRARIEGLAAEAESVAQRRQAAEELYRSEFGELAAEAPEPFERVVDVGPLTGMSWAEAMTRVLQEAGGPLHVKDIWQRLQAGGFRTDSRDPIRSLVSIAVRNAGTFPKSGANRYGLASATAAEGVMPESDSVV